MESTVNGMSMSIFGTAVKKGTSDRIIALQRLEHRRIAAGNRKPGGVADRVDDRQHGKLAECQSADGIERRLPAADVGN